MAEGDIEKKLEEITKKLVEEGIKKKTAKHKSETIKYQPRAATKTEPLVEKPFFEVPYIQLSESDEMLMRSVNDMYKQHHPFVHLKIDVITPAIDQIGITASSFNEDKVQTVKHSTASSFDEDKVQYIKHVMTSSLKSYFQKSGLRGIDKKIALMDPDEQYKFLVRVFDEIELEDSKEYQNAPKDLTYNSIKQIMKETLPIPNYYWISELKNKIFAQKVNHQERIANTYRNMGAYKHLKRLKEPQRRKLLNYLLKVKNG